MNDGPGRRFEIRYATQRWEDGRWFYGSLLLILAVLTIFNIVVRKSIVSFIPVLVLDAVILGGLYLMRRVSYVEVGAQALTIRYLFKRVELPYSALSKVRRQALEVAFAPAERRRYVNRFVRRLAKQPAAYLRLDRRQADVLNEVTRQLGPRFIAGPDLVLPLVDVDAFIAETKGRLRGA